MLQRRFAIAACMLAAVVAGCSTSRSLPDVAGASALLRTATTSAVKIKEFADLPRYSGAYLPFGIAAGPKHSLWVTDYIDSDFGTNAVVQIAISGKMLNTYYPPDSGTSLYDIVEGPDRALWMTDTSYSRVLRMTDAGVFSDYNVGATPFDIIVGPDKALWFTEASAIGRLTTAGAVTTFAGGSGNENIVTGSDGALWFTENYANAIGRITTTGKMTQYTAGISSGAGLWGIAAGPDGALWFTESSGGRIGRITTAGAVTEYSSGITPGEQPRGIVAGPDGAMWFTEYTSPNSFPYGSAKIGRITTNGVISEYHKGLTNRAGPGNIVQGPDARALWFVETGIDKTGRVNL